MHASNGTKIWTYPTKTAPVIAKGIVYAASAGGELVALRASDGRPMWHSPVLFTVGPVIAANAVYVSDVTNVYALRT